MGTIVLTAFISLDGVVQGGGGPDEDRAGGFALGGWSTGYDEEHDDGEGGRLVEEWESRTEALLLGRTTYDIWAGAWGVWSEDEPGLMGDLTRRYNRVPKYVASRTRTGFGWRNSHLLGPDVPAAAVAVRDETDGEVRIWGSTQLVRTLAEHDLIDEYRLARYPIVLGTGKKLFPDGFPLSRLRLADSRALPSGVVVDTFQRMARGGPAADLP